MNPKNSGVVVATPSAEASAAPWVTLLGAQFVSEAPEPALAATRSSYALADGTVDFLTPAGDGPIAAAVAERGSHLYAALLDVDDPAGLTRAPYGDHATALQHGEHLFRWEEGELAGLRVVARSRRDRQQVGALKQWYEATWLVPDPAPAVRHLADWLQVDADNFVPNDDERWAYRGTLTLFAPGRLPRFEVVTPFDSTMPMGRFFDKFGPSLYMAFAESARMGDIVRAADAPTALSVEEDEEGPHTIFALPRGLGGMLLGISREDYAWNWSRGRVFQ